VVPPLVLKLEHGHLTRESELAELADEISAVLHKRLKVRPVIEWVVPGDLPRSTHKTSFFEKNYENSE
jgi:phenylacetate-CoA ligase